jgi:hypothetical protein
MVESSPPQQRNHRCSEKWWPPSRKQWPETSTETSENEALKNQRFAKQSTSGADSTEDQEAENQVRQLETMRRHNSGRSSKS